MSMTGAVAGSRAYQSVAFDPVADEEHEQHERAKRGPDEREEDEDLEEGLGRTWFSDYGWLGSAKGRRR